MTAGAAGRLDDAPARERIRTDLDSNLLVEAGAGSGKTTALVDRMLQLVVVKGAQIDQIAAVTFTRKAAGELRQRFQERLEAALAAPATPDEARARLSAALRGIDSSFMGTIHAFCAKLLRERPLDARLDPAFRELTAPEERTLARRFWDQHLERLVTEGQDGGVLARLDAVGLQPSRLFDHFRAMNEASDIDFPVPEAPLPDPMALARVRKEMEAIVDEALPGIPRVRPERNWDSTQKRILRIAYRRAALDFDRTVDLMEAIQDLCSSATAKATYKRWDYDSGRVKEIQARIDALIEVTPERPDPPARKLVSAWQAHRYGPVMELVRGAAQAFAHHRRRTGQLTFHDLLVLARDLLSGSPSARRSLGERWRYLLVDEFQDTDPLQAELLFLLASEPDDDGGAERAWAQLTPRPGALFVVGDPKQSIYRFRRADIALYGRVRERFAEFGAVVALTTNFRSTPPIEAIVDGVFAPDATTAPGLFPGEATDVQAGYAPLDTRPAGPGKPEGGVYRYTLPADVGRRDELVDVDAQSLATWIAGRLAQGRQPEDFLVLTRTRRGLDRYARALEAHAIPVAVSGSGVGIETELSELRLLMTALTDPGDPVGVLAALEGLFFGVDLDQLLQHREAGGTLDFRRPNQPPGPVTDALALLQEWWQLARQRPADEVVERIVASVGLLPWAAGGELGELRAGALAFTLDLVRTAAVADDASLSGALEALALVLDDDDTDVEAPLEPGRESAVRVMNLHKAKGLEAPIVVLACPTGKVPLGRTVVVERDASGRSAGYCAVTEQRSRWSWVTLAAAPGWDARSEREDAFERAEQDRLLYVAVTRAEEELVVGMKAPGGRERGPWAPLEPWLLQEATELEWRAEPPPPRRELEHDEALTRREREVAERRCAAGEAAWDFE
ncbi:MAG: UvrD-helicase domain-containing protein, partial [Gemmatimonadetes bacterium]|nr:UvrD-helicase domain-containing protein [Gemmatimonadota bacterium]